MNITATPPAIHPQPSWLPKPLVIHPSIPDDLVREMLRVADLFHAEPHKFIGSWARLREGECGCICAHLVNFNEGSECVGNHLSLSACQERWPQFSRWLNHTYAFAGDWNVTEAIARITRFLESAT